MINLKRLNAFLNRRTSLVRSLIGILGALGLVTISGLIRGMIPVPILPYLLFVPAIGTAAFLFGLLSGITAVTAATLAAIYFFLPPDVGFVIQDFSQGLSVFLFVLVTLGIATVCATLRASLLRIERSKDELEDRIEAALHAQRRIEEALRQSQKMEAVGQLTGGIAHDFNNMLAAISGSVELMRRNVDRQQYAKLPRYLDTVEHATASAADLTSRLLAFSRGQRLEPRIIDVAMLVRGFETVLRRTLPTVAVQVECDCSWSALVDPGQLENALLNLCLNARDAMPDGGTIRVTVAKRLLDEHEAADRALAPGEYVSLRVYDTGVGMSEETAARAFDPFFTTKGLGKGTGLGLSMVYGFARQSGGSVKVHSTIGTGTRICLLLPRNAGSPASHETVTRMSTSMTGHETILLVDDEATVRMVVEESLLDLGYQVLTAEDGEAGLAVLRSGCAIDMLISDVMMPRMDGPTMVQACREMRPSLPVVYITGYAANLLTGLDEHASILTKPFLIADLAERIRATLS